MLGYGDSPESTASPVILGQSPKDFQDMDEERFIGRTMCYTVVNSNFSFVNKGNRTGAKYFSGYK